MKFDNNLDNQELVKKLVSLRRNSRTVKGGRIMSIAALAVVGDGKNKVGFALGKSKETSISVQQAMRKAKNNMVFIHRGKEPTIPYNITYKEGATKVFIGRAAPGTGLITSSTMRSIFEALGVEDIISKVYGSTNPINVIRVTIKALQKLHSISYIMNKRGKDVSYFFGNKKDNINESITD